MDMLAWHACVVLQPHTKKGQKITPAKLRGKSSKQYTSGGQVLEELENRQEEKEIENFWKKGKGKKWLLDQSET